MTGNKADRQAYPYDTMYFANRHTNQYGVAMIVVLWFLVLLTIMAGSFALTIRRESELVRNAKAEAVSGALADGGLYYAMMMLSQSNPEKKWRTDGTIYEVALGRGRIRVRIYDEAGKFDINNADASVLRSLFSSLGLTDDEAEQLAHTVVDWRDEDDLNQSHGAEKDDYLDAGRNYGPRNKPFQSLEELRLVLGVDYKIYQKLEPLVTIYSGKKGIDPGTGSKRALLALPDIDQEIVDNFLQARAETRNIGGLTEQFRGIEGVGLGGKKNQVFEVRVEARIENGPVTAVSAIIKRSTGKFGEPFALLKWRRYLVGKISLFSKIDSESDLDGSVFEAI